MDVYVDPPWDVILTKSEKVPPHQKMCVWYSLVQPWPSRSGGSGNTTATEVEFRRGAGRRKSAERFPIDRAELGKKPFIAIVSRDFKLIKGGDEIYAQVPLPQAPSGMVMIETPALGTEEERFHIRLCAANEDIEALVGKPIPLCVTKAEPAAPTCRILRSLSTSVEVEANGPGEVMLSMDGCVLRKERIPHAGAHWLKGLDPDTTYLLSAGKQNEGAALKKSIQFKTPMCADASSSTSASRASPVRHIDKGTQKVEEKVGVVDASCGPEEPGVRELTSDHGMQTEPWEGDLMLTRKDSFLFSAFNAWHQRTRHLRWVYNYAERRTVEREGVIGGCMRGWYEEVARRNKLELHEKRSALRDITNKFEQQSIEYRKSMHDLEQQSMKECDRVRGELEALKRLRREDEGNLTRLCGNIVIDLPFPQTEEEQEQCKQAFLQVLASEAGADISMCTAALTEGSQKFEFEVVVEADCDQCHDIATTMQDKIKQLAACNEWGPTLDLTVKIAKTKRQQMIDAVLWFQSMGQRSQLAAIAFESWRRAWLKKCICFQPMDVEVTQLSCVRIPGGVRLTWEGPTSWYEVETELQGIQRRDRFMAAATMMSTEKRIPSRRRRRLTVSSFYEKRNGGRRMNIWSRLRNSSDSRKMDGGMKKSDDEEEGDDDDGDKDAVV